MIDKNRLEEKCSTWNIALTGTQLDQLDAFAEILVEYNQKVNLTAITDPEGIEDKHFLDSLLFAAQPEVAGKMVDVGAGAGFPGIVTKIYKPELEMTLMEPTGKRVEFLKYACDQLGLTGVEFAKERAEEAARTERLLRYVQRQEHGGVCELDVLCGAAAFRHLRRFDFYGTEEDGKNKVTVNVG